MEPLAFGRYPFGPGPLDLIYLSGPFGIFGVARRSAKCIDPRLYGTIGFRKLSIRPGPLDLIYPSGPFGILGVASPPTPRPEILGLISIKIVRLYLYPPLQSAVAQSGP